MAAEVELQQIKLHFIPDKMCRYLGLLTVVLISSPNYWRTALSLVGLGAIQHIQCLPDIIYFYFFIYLFLAQGCIGIFNISFNFK